MQDNDLSPHRIDRNTIAVEASPRQSLAELFEIQVNQTPDRIALIDQDRQLTYGELNQCANQLAHYLLRIGVGPEVVVGVCLDRSIHTPIALLGILKAGGAYAPLDAADPPSYTSFIIEDTRTPVIITERKYIPHLMEYNVVLVALDVMWEQIAHSSGVNQPARANLENLAQVLYTLGSTGQPHGMATLQRQLLGSQDGAFEIGGYSFYPPGQADLEQPRVTIGNPGGMPINLVGIAAVLKQHTSVQQAIVTARPQSEDDQLIAYVVPAPGQVVDNDELRRFLKQRLPNYMIPARFIGISVLPLTADGTIDHMALPAPSQIDSVTPSQSRPSRKQLEQMIATLWQTALQLDDISIDDNFFDMGAYSLLIARVRDHLEEILQRRIEILELFLHPTIRTLAEHLAADVPEQPTVEIETLQEQVQTRKDARRRRKHQREQSSFGSDLPDSFNE